MRIALVYDSPHGHTLKLVERLKPLLSVPIQTYHASSAAEWSDFDAFLLFCPTYGDEELSDDMETFLTALSVREKKYAVCEVGNYYGYDDPEFGPGRIVRPVLAKLGWTEFFPIASIDSMPATDWPEFEAWVKKLDVFLRTQ